MSIYLLIISGMRRKPGTLLEIEVSVLRAAIDMRNRGQPDFHGFAIAKEIKDREQARMLTAHGTLYRALSRMERAGLLASRWEDPGVAAANHRPLRRLYQVTGKGEKALAEARRSQATPGIESAPGMATL